MSANDGVVVRELTKRYGQKLAVDKLSLTVPRGAIVGLLGFNGAGKSTTIDVLATLTQPTSGTASLAGHDVVREPLAARRAMAIVFESALPARPTWTVEEYLSFFQALRGASAPSDDIMALLDVAGLRKQTTGTLSSGQRKRVEIARAMAARPSVLLLDEPTKEVDMKGKRTIWSAVRAQAAEGMSVLISSHDVMEVRELCDRVLVMHEGKLTASLERREISNADPVALESMLIARMEGR